VYNQGPVLMPWTGFFISGFIAWLCKLPKKQIITISIETGIQNVGMLIKINILKIYFYY
jgi:predicted Na+-dependent transporter